MSFVPYSDSQRGYGILQFSGDNVLPAFTNAGTGIDAPNGIVTIQHLYLVTPTVFENGKWWSPWTVDGACDWSDAVLTIGFEDSSNRLAAAHYQEEGTGTRTFLSQRTQLPSRAVGSPHRLPELLRRPHVHLARR